MSQLTPATTTPLSSSTSSLLQDSPRSPPIPQIPQSPQVPISVTKALPGQLVHVPIPASLSHAISPLQTVQITPLTSLTSLTPSLPPTAVTPATPTTPPAQPWFSAAENVIIDIELDDPDDTPVPKPLPLQKGSYFSII